MRKGYLLRNELIASIGDIVAGKQLLAFNNLSIKLKSAYSPIRLTL